MLHDRTFFIPAFINKFAGGRNLMRKGRIVIEYESNDSGDCKFNIHQDGVDHLNNDNLISLFEHILGDLIQEQF